MPGAFEDIAAAEVRRAVGIGTPVAVARGWLERAGAVAWPLRLVAARLPAAAVGRRFLPERWCRWSRRSLAGRALELAGAAGMAGG